MAPDGRGAMSFTLTITRSECCLPAAVAHWCGSRRLEVLRLFGGQDGCCSAAAVLVGCAATWELGQDAPRAQHFRRQFTQAVL